MMAGGEGGLEGWLVFKFKSVRVCLRAACFEHSLRLSSGKRSTAGAGAGAGQQGQPVFAYAGREGRSFNATRGQALLPAVIGGHARAALDAVNIYCRPGRLLRARAYVRSTAHAAHRRPRYGRRYTCRRSTSGQHIEAPLRYTGRTVNQWRLRACATVLPSPSAVNVAMAWRCNSRPHACPPWQQSSTLYWT
jgi:hypothetical protein